MSANPEAPASNLARPPAVATVGERSPAESATELPAHPRPDLATAYAAPATRAEQILAGIWEQLLGVERIGTDDNFFALGGDSIISLQMIARATKAGLRLSSKQVFQHQTIAELAAMAGDATAATPAPRHPLVDAGVVPLTPIQEWFFEQDAVHVDHFNQAVMLQGCFYGYQHVFAAVDNQHRPLVGRQNLPQWPLIGVIEVASIGNTEHRVVQPSHVRQAFAQKP